MLSSMMRQSTSLNRTQKKRRQTVMSRDVRTLRGTRWISLPSRNPSFPLFQKLFVALTNRIFNNLQQRLMDLHLFDRLETFLIGKLPCDLIVRVGLDTSNDGYDSQKLTSLPRFHQAQPSSIRSARDPGLIRDALGANEFKSAHPCSIPSPKVRQLPGRYSPAKGPWHDVVWP
jgi:hypothetical protein